MSAWILVAVGGAAGAVTRYGFTVLLSGNTAFPLATMLVNVIGSLAIGLVSGYLLHGAVAVFGP